MGEYLEGEHLGGRENRSEKISALVISYNRANLIETCLRALSFADELLVVDKSSTDGTLEIAQTLAHRTISVPWSPVVEDTRQFAISQCTHEWVLCLDDDECVSVETGKYLRSELKNPRADVYQLPQRHYILGIHDERAYYWPEHQARFFRKDAVEILSTVHGGIKPKTDRVYAIPPESGVCMHHLSHASVEQWIEKSNRYTSRIDRARDDDGGSDLIAYAHARIDGWAGMSKSQGRGDYPAAVGLLRAVYDIIDRLKTWELEEGIDGEKRFEEICQSLQKQYIAVFPQAATADRRANMSVAGDSFPTEGGNQRLFRVDAENNTLRENLRRTRMLVDELRRHAGLTETSIDVLSGEQKSGLVHRLQEAENHLSDARKRLEAVQKERDDAQRAVVASQEAEALVRESLSGLLSSRARTISEKDAQIAHLTQRVSEAEQLAAAERAQRAEIEHRLGAVLSSEAWKLTAPVRAIVEVTRRSARLQNARMQLVRKAVLSGDPAAKQVLSNSFRRRMGGSGALPPPQPVTVSTNTNTALLAPHESVTVSYSSWLLRMDTPDAEVLAAMEATCSSIPEVVVVVRLTAKAAEVWNETLEALRKIIGLKWTAFVLVEHGVDAALAQKCAKSLEDDPRFSFSRPELNDDQVVLLIDAGAIPRTHGPRVLVDALLRSATYRLAYSDEDHLPASGLPQDPWFKPDFSPLLTKQGLLLGKMVALRWSSDMGSEVAHRMLDQEVDLNLVAQEIALSIDKRAITHVPHVTFHDATPTFSPLPVDPPALPDSLPVVSVLIPTRDGWHLLGPCLDSLRKTDWPKDKLEVIVIDNGSVDPVTIDGMSLAEREGRIRILRDPREFNYARLNNVAARACRGELLVLLNNDTEIIDPAWLKKMAAYALLPDVGAVGPKLLYGDGTVQHAGVVLGIQGVAAHAHLFLGPDEGGYRGIANATHEVAAVTGACLMVSKAAFDEVGGLREELRVAFNDVVFCLDLLAHGRRNIYFAEALVTHHESKTRGYDDKPEKVKLLRKEARIAWSLHRDRLWRDPYYSPNLSMESTYKLAFAPRRRPAWSDITASHRPRVMMLSSTHARGHGVAVVVELQVRALLAGGYDVIIAGFLGANDFEYTGCQKVDVRDPRSAATIAVEMGVDVIVAHTPPFFDVARWTGNVPPVIAYDYGEPPPYLFPDAEARQDILDQKALSLGICAKVFAISNAVAQEAVTPPDGVIPLGNEHLGQWNQDSNSRRARIRRKNNWDDKFVILNVCRFHAAERLYKGVDRYIEMYEMLQLLDPILAARTVLVLCGKGDADDIAQMTAHGVCVHANVSDEEMVDLYAGADLYANFSRWEGYNLGIGQALAMGLPVIASDIPAHRAFAVDVTDDPVAAATIAKNYLNGVRERNPRIWTWEEPLASFVNEVDKIMQANVAVN
ncbi:glycosyltransferase [Burkholderia orbicola]|uniref:glycosyltransferase n=1 Tax=Burkholderia orbicola TaxID=2978683 RepID=UPI002FE1D042